MAWIISNDHKLLDCFVTHEEELTETGNGDRAGVGTAEECLLEEPFVENNLETNSIFNARLNQKLYDFSRVSLNKSCKDKNQRLDDRWHS